MAHVHNALKLPYSTGYWKEESFKNADLFDESYSSESRLLIYNTAYYTHIKAFLYKLIFRDHFDFKFTFMHCKCYRRGFLKVPSLFSLGIITVLNFL